MSMQKKWTTDNIPDLSGKVAIVTGSNVGIGFEAAKELAKKNATVVMACRNLEKGDEAAAKTILSTNSSLKLEVMKLDLSSLKSVKDFADEFTKKYDRLDLLINNAGVMMPPYSKTEDGFELQFGTNHLGHFALTGHLLPMILKTDGSRIVNVSSMAHNWGEIYFDDLNFEKKYNKRRAYGQSKIANLYFTYELQRKFAAIGSTSISTAAHPGWTATELQRHNKLFEFFNPFFAQKPMMGALPTLRAAVDPEAKGGDYYGPKGFKEIWGYPIKVKSNEISHDKNIASRLWEVSEELTGVKFSFEK